MTVITITYPAKCKDCAHLVRTTEGRRTVSRCAREIGKLHATTEKGWPVTLRTRACGAFKLG